MAKRFRHPPESVVASTSRSVKPTRPRVSARRPARSDCGTAAFCSARSTTLNTVSPAAKSEICDTQLRRVPLRTATSPVSGVTRPARISSKVDLPEPFGPITPMQSPLETVNEMSRNNGVLPYFLDNPCALIIGGKFLGSAPVLSLPCYDFTLLRCERTISAWLPLAKSKMAHNYDALILGAGAAGLMCAIEAGKRGRRVAVLERAARAGKKILISGGGRCNFTNLHCRPENFISANPHFAKSALARYTPADFIALVEKHNIPYHEKTLGQLFCDGSARDIVAMLEAECRAAK